jgi:N-acetylneuraminate synthase
MKNSVSFKIGNRRIGDNCDPLVIAEIGINHNGSLDLAVHLADEAINSGAEMIKHQTHIVSDEMTEKAKKIKPGNSDESIFKIMDSCALDEKDEKKLMNYIIKKKKIFISSPFSRKAVDRLESFNVPAYKIGSGECNNYPFVEYVAKKKKPIILSTGMNNIQQITKTVSILRKYKTPYALLHCTNVYPTPYNIVRLECVSQLKRIFKDAVVGLSDHTLSNHTCLASVALGARVLERHFIDKKSRKGPDVACSMTPSELKDLIEGSRNIFLALKGKKELVKQEIVTARFAFGSVSATKNIKKGEIISKENIFPKRPGNGFYTADDYYKLLGKKVKKNILAGSQLKKGDV